MPGLGCDAERPVLPRPRYQLPHDKRRKVGRQQPFLCVRKQTANEAEAAESRVFVMGRTWPNSYRTATQVADLCSSYVLFGAHWLGTPIRNPVQNQMPALRLIELPFETIPLEARLLLCSTPAGFPSPAADDIEEPIDLGPVTRSLGKRPTFGTSREHGRSVTCL